MIYNKYNTFNGRFWAGFLDGLILMPFALCDYIFLKPDNSLFIVIPWLIISYLLYFVYSIVLHWKYGQTVGKRIMKVSVVNASEENGLSLRQAILRDSIPLILQVLLLFKLVLVTIRIGHYSEMDIIQESILLSYVSLGWFITEVVTMLTNKKRRALHDFIANTVVINSNAKNENT